MRIELPDEDQSDPMVNLAKTYAPAVVNAGMGFSGTVYEQSILPLRIFEAARFKTALINGCTICQKWRSAREVPAYMARLGRMDEAGVAANGIAPDEAFYVAITENNLSALSERERLAVQFADAMGLNPQGAADDETLWGAIKAVFTDEEIVDLTFSVGAFIALGRVMHVLGLDSVCVIPTMQPALAA